MRSDHEPFLPQLLILFREDEEGAVREPEDGVRRAERRQHHAHGLRRSAPVRRTG